VRIVDAKLGTPVTSPLEGHDSDVTCLVFSPDMTFLVSGGYYDEDIIFWNLSRLANGEVTQTCRLHGHIEGLQTLALSPNNKFLLSAGHDWVVRVWDMSTKKLIRELLRHSYTAFVGWTPCGEFIVTVDQKFVRVWGVHEEVCVCVRLHLFRYTHA
jgi:WD40 repeat protein